MVHYLSGEEKEALLRTGYCVLSITDKVEIGEKATAKYFSRWADDDFDEVIYESVKIEVVATQRVDRGLYWKYTIVKLLS